MKNYLLIVVSMLGLSAIAMAADIDELMPVNVMVESQQVVEAVGVTPTIEDPVEMLRAAASTIISQLETNKALYQRDANALNQLVYRELVPLVDQRGVARSILGRENWQNATPSQRNEFVRRFTDLVVLTYAGALANHDDEYIIFDNRVRGNIEDKQRIIVSSVVAYTGNSIPVQFSLVYKEDVNGWRVYDLNVSGVSMLRSFRMQVSEQLHSMSLEDLLVKLAKRQIELEIPESDSESS